MSSWRIHAPSALGALTLARFSGVIFSIGPSLRTAAAWNTPAERDMFFRSFRFFELPTKADTGTGSVERPCFLSDHIRPPLLTLGHAHHICPPCRLPILCENRFNLKTIFKAILATFLSKVAKIALKIVFKLKRFSLKVGKKVCYRVQIAHHRTKKLGSRYILVSGWHWSHYVHLGY